MANKIYNLDKDFIIDQLDKKVTVAAISRFYKCSTWVVYDFCQKNNIETPTKLKNLTGTEFGFFKVLDNAGQTGLGKSKRTWWNCECKCGNIKKLCSGDINAKNRISCGKCLYEDSNIKKLNLCNWKGFNDISGTYFKSIYNGAISREQEFSITIEYIWDLFIKQDKKCALTEMDITLIPKYSKTKEQTASLDRIDSLKGYIEYNVQWIHKDVNIMKWDFDQDYYIDICQKVIDHKNRV